MPHPDKKIRRTHRQAYHCGDETCKRIIEAAIDVFATKGFQAATTRQIAEKAGVNTPALQYYFENKEGLYRACAELITHDASSHFKSVLSMIEAHLLQPVSRKQAICLFCDLQDSIVDRLLGCGEQDDTRRLFMAMSQTGQGLECGFTLMREHVADKIDSAAQTLVAIACSLPPEEPLVKVRAMTLLGQTLIFHVGRRYTEAALNWTQISGEDLDLLKTVLREQSVAALSSYGG
ncbi:DUF1956 domain-containing protein (plasmid) [Pseudomonas sp. Leaf58]|uniref:CerR family C-terminal domain-containing protein n=1 Tax=Pseudomonas sp. Leaf58 TaxID=1736226 RepID=UPI0006F8AD7F|nr:CerR family C-terminal domain-containing protein [Pseudomonas sp. Leaf58]AYG48244.1 DUF1956 domain-containing protein [Pseudomonas sp. Leaf58]KQN62208.1 hypothetical protein ASF02_08575 [Pseudomonas sp. Leaf58]